MSILREGVACVTERELTDDELPTDAWTMAMLYAEEGSLVDAPLWLRHSLGETVVDVLMKQGIELDRDASWKCAASSLCDQWRALVEEINEDWSHAVSQVSTFSRADRAVYEALKQSLHLARDLLRPVLSDEAEAVYSEIAERRGTERSVDLFWELALIPPSYYLGRPDDTVWNALELRERTFVATLIAQTLHAAPPAPEKVAFQGMDEVDDDVARTHIARLVGLREMGLWDAYFAEYLMLVKTIVRDGMVDPDLIPWWDPEDET